MTLHPCKGEGNVSNGLKLTATERGIIEIYLYCDWESSTRAPPIIPCECKETADVSETR
jgi:hypothetical protein